MVCVKLIRLGESIFLVHAKARSENTQRTLRKASFCKYSRILIPSRPLRFFASLREPLLKQIAWNLKFIYNSMYTIFQNTTVKID